MKTVIKKTYTPQLSTAYAPPFFENGVSAGFPSPAADYEEQKLDLNKHLIKHPAATFFVKASGDSMIGAGVHTGDILIVDRSLEPQDKNVVIAIINGELTVKRIRIRRNKISLVAENNDYPIQDIPEDAEFEVWGIVTYVVHSL